MIRQKTRIRFLKARVESAMRRGDWFAAEYLHSLLIDAEIAAWGPTQ